MSSRKTKKARKEVSDVPREEEESEEEEEEEEDSSEEEEESEEGEASGAPADSMSTTAGLSKSSWEDLGLSAPICEACRSLKWTNPSQIQVESIPYALDGKDIIGLAETGSGKTGAFILPVLHNLLKAPQRLHTLVMTPTRELAFQIAEQTDALGSIIGVQCAVIVGGIDMMAQVRVTRRQSQ